METPTHHSAATRPAAADPVSHSWFQLDGFTDRRRGIGPLDVVYGPDRVADIGRLLTGRGRSRALLVAGAHVSTDVSVMGPIRESLGDLVVGEFFEATPRKRIESIYAGIERMTEVDADVLIGIGGGSSLDTARQISAFAADGRPLSSFRDSVLAGEVPELTAPADRADVALIPTTLAGADLSKGGSIEVVAAPDAPDGRPKRINPQTVGPSLIVYDPRLFESTPRALLTGSAMNGLNKGIETLYSPRATLYSDALAAHGLTLMTTGLLGVAAGDPAGLERAVGGVILVQLQRQISVLHAFGHAVARYSGVQQGVAHAVITPHALRALLAVAPMRRDLIATTLRAAGVTAAADDAEAIIESVVTVRDALGLPARLRDVPGADALDPVRCAEHVCSDGLLAGAPLDRPLAVDEAVAVFEAAA